MTTAGQLLFLLKYFIVCRIHCCFFYLCFFNYSMETHEKSVYLDPIRVRLRFKSGTLKTLDFGDLTIALQEK